MNSANQYIHLYLSKFTLEIIYTLILSLFGLKHFKSSIFKQFFFLIINTLKDVVKFNLNHLQKRT